MRQVTFLSALVSISLVISCSDGLFDSETLYDITFINETSYILTISDSYSDDFSTFEIGSGETKVIKSKSSYILFDVSHPQTLKIIDYERITDTRIRLYQYDYTVQYKITGSARSVDVTLNNSTGGTEQYDDVPVPKTYSYKYFSDDFLYISAQNQGESGTVTVSIYFEDEPFKSSTSSGAYVIASAYGSKP